MCSPPQGRLCSTPPVSAHENPTDAGRAGQFEGQRLIQSVNRAKSTTMNFREVYHQVN